MAKTLRKRKRSISRSRSRKRRSSMNIRAGLPNYKKLAKEYKIIDVPFEKGKHKGTKASCASINYHYQNYSNVLDFLYNIKENKDLYFFKYSEPFLSFDINKIKKGIITYSSKKLFISEIKKGLTANKQFIPIIFNITTNEGNHANILLINKKNKTIELYEPHGSRVSSSVLGGVVGAYKKKIRVLRDFFRDILPSFQLINVVEFQQGTAFQMLRDPNQHTGYCVTWTILFIHYRILNKHVPLNILMRYIHMRINTTKLLQYTKFVETFIKKK